MAYYFAETDLEVKQSTDSNVLGDLMGYGMVNGVNTAFIRHADGSQESIIPPDVQFGVLSSIGGPPANGYYVNMAAINNLGVAAGYFTDTSGKVRGLIYDHGTYTLVDAPSANRTWIQFIDDYGNLYGKCQAPLQPEQRFMASASVPFDSTPIGDWYLITDRSHSFGDHGQWYHGPVDWIVNETAFTSDAVNILGLMPMTFIHTGNGDDAIAVQTGDNIVDGGNGSNFLTSGTGHDEFYVDIRSRSADVWSSVDNFHTGDKATMWGVTPAAFRIEMFDHQGAVGHEGLTISMTAPGRTDANLTITGYTIKDVGSRLALTFGHSPDVSGLPGSDYMQVVGV